MTAQAVRRLRELARSDPAVAPLAALQAEALEAAAEKGWDAALAAFAPDRLADALPLLHGATLTADAERVRTLLLRLVGEAERAGGEAEGPRNGAEGSRHGPDLAAVRRALSAGALDPPALLAAVIAQDDARLVTLAAGAGADAGLLGTLGGLAALPLLLACGEKAAPLVERSGWGEGYCPVCAAWPALAELRGLEKRRWLRCARCGSGWPVAHEGCVFCGEADWRRIGYLAPEGDTESRRAVTCDSCHGYLKTLASLAPIPPAEVGLTDLTTLELDVAALERDFVRPELPALPLEVAVEPARRRGLFGRR